MTTLYFARATFLAAFLFVSGLFLLADSSAAEGYTPTTNDSLLTQPGVGEHFAGRFDSNEPTYSLASRPNYQKQHRRKRTPTPMMGRFGVTYRQNLWDVCNDYKTYYGCRSLLWQTGIFGIGAVFANTSIDEEFRNWIQDDVRSNGTDDFSKFFKVFGEGAIFIPAFAALTLISPAMEDIAVLGPVGRYSTRVMRGYLVGAPAMLLMQCVTGGSRPGEASYNSEWRFFADNNGVSGHAFIGSIPFITLAMSTDNRLLKAALYTLSTFTAYSRVNDDDHYLSQAILGWTMAYYACSAVAQTDCQKNCRFRYNLAPIVSPAMQGMAINISY